MINLNKVKPKALPQLEDQILINLGNREDSYTGSACLEKHPQSE